MITDYPIHIDIFALVIFLGAVQGIFLSYFFLSKHNREVKANIFLGILLIASSLLCFDILISYTNFMFRVIYLVDVTEPMNFVIGPAFYLYITAKIDESKIKKIQYHFLPALLYFFYTIFYHLENLEVKYNSYLDQYHPELDYVPVLNRSFSDPLLLKYFVNELTILSISVYLLLSVSTLYRAQTNKFENPNYKTKYNILWFDIGMLTTILIILIFVKLFYTHDLGDYIIITAICIFIYSISFKIIKDSLFFKGSSSYQKYSKSALDEETKSKILSKIVEQMEAKYYLSNSPSLPDLANKVRTSSNYVSQVINEKLNLTFLELINKYRIEEAKKMILDTDINESMEEIAYTVGFNSKSTFHSSFKKITGKTPLEFKNSHN